MVNATEHDQKIIDAVSVAMGGQIGREDDAERLVEQVVNGEGGNPVLTACEIAVAFIRFAQDLKTELAVARSWANYD